MMDPKQEQARRIAKRVPNFPEHTAEELDAPVPDNFFAGDPTKMTNPSARKFLGIAGYFFAEKVIGSEPLETISTWTRGTDLVVLYEHPNKNPRLTDRNGKHIAWKQLGTRNPVVQANAEG